MASVRGAATAAAIEEAALDLALDRGYERLTVDLICEAVGISQRTFFNHFPTKEDALLGQERPRIDERAARRFIVGTGPLLSEALGLIAPPAGGVPVSRLPDRMRVISSSPALLSAHLGRIAAIDAEVRELVVLRLGHQAPALDERRREEEAEMVSSLLGSVMRWVASSASRGDVRPEFEAHVERARATLERVIERSRPLVPPAGADLGA